MLSDIFIPGLSALTKAIFENRKAKRITIIAFAAFITATLVIIIYAFIVVSDKTQKDYILNSILPFFAAPGGFLALLFISHFASRIPDVFEIQLEKLREERVEITQKIEQEKELDIFHTIQLSLNQLNEYYTINKGQARSSFRFSIFSIVVGLITIVTGIWFFYFGRSNIELTFITGISGVLLEFIGGAYFFMYKKSLEQVNFFFGQLIKIQDTMLAINLANNIEDKEKRTVLTDKIITSLLERSLK
jgi:MFS family permease